MKLMQITNETNESKTYDLAKKLWRMDERNVQWSVDHNIPLDVTQDYMQQVVHVVLGEDYPEMFVYVGGSHIAVHLFGNRYERDILITNEEWR